MSAQNGYKIARNHKSKNGWFGWITNSAVWQGSNWQEAIQNWLDEHWVEDVSGGYQVVSETPSEDGRSGIIEMQLDPPGFWVGAKIKATLIKDDRTTFTG